MDYEQEKEAIKALVESGEITYHDHFIEMGRLGAKLRWANTTDEERKEVGRRLTESRKK